MSWQKIILLLAIVFTSLENVSKAFYIPGVSPNEFKAGDLVEVTGIKLTSSSDPLPYAYNTLAFCKSKNDKSYASESLGAILRGDRPVSTAYEIKMKDSGCFVACEKTLTPTEILEFTKFIQNNYYVQLLVDNLPTATKLTSAQDSVVQYGYPLGQVLADKPILHNHLTFRLKYHTKDNEYFRVVGLEIIPLSFMTNKCKVNAERYLTLSEKTNKVTFTYEVIWEKSDIRWASRWDVFLGSGNGKVHWFSIINSLIIIFVLSTIIAVIFIRVLRRDIAKYNRDEESFHEDILEESGWKLVHGDVFRPPRFSRLYTAFIGTGVQLTCMVFIVIFFAMLGMLSPASRGALMSAAIFTYSFMGAFAGYFAGRFYKMLRGKLWVSTALTTGMLFPTMTLGIGLILNFFLVAKSSSAAVPFTAILSLCALWWCISVPLIFVGFFFGFRKRAYEQPVRTNQIPRAVPSQPFLYSLSVSTMLAGVVPFGSAFIEIFYIFSAIWERQVYYLFGFLFIVFIILVISTAEIAIIMVYFQLCNEDYHWWWRSLITSGGAALYLFFYAFIFYWTKLEITEFVPTVIYFGYSLIMVTSFWIMLGTVGVYSALLFIRKIYSAIKID